ncbi:MAG: imidazole glycerol phosphate synthase subunit HisH [Sphingopyxis sp.]|jgi:glutamine amidotransferase|uniref:imidazole glycerol phosphate synthase subunit HisH n=1 Tax=Sphingopyxis sp. TaxID=1908224 RepID=UPI001A3D9643|nr:imidazole glycerol phosphate synthase subunit HisH [Sphingopyxis sp.]MBL9071700.1 imidazole glycerol phosphate synthase subunit HisH [Sphingopyxis sp.]
MATVTIVNYGLGNVHAFANIYHRLNIDVAIIDDAAGLAAAERLILPGVGAFDWAMTRLNVSGLRDALDHAVVEKGVPVLGVCVGMQMMALSSDEGTEAGLGWIDARVARLEAPDAHRYPLPHMGWNDVRPRSSDSLFTGIEAPRYYFLHSYYFVPEREEDVLATASYGGDFTAAIRKGNIIGTQFHPEKSHQWGIDLLRNFAKI